MKFKDIAYVVLIIVAFGILHLTGFIMLRLKELEEDWPKHRCNPMTMPFASYLGHDPIANFTYCVGNIQKDLMGFFLEPIEYVLSMVGQLGEWILGRLNLIREFFNMFRKFLSTMVGDIYGMFVNVLIQVQSLVIKLKDTVMKLVGILMTFMYLIQGAMMTGQSINRGPIGETLRAVCFHKNTPVSLKNGTTVLMKDIQLGAILENGAEVYGLLTLKGDSNNPYYKIWSDKLNSFIFVTGDHKILVDDNKSDIEGFKPVRDVSYALKTDICDDELSCLITSNHRIPVGEFTFWDWED
ncbi:MAG: hypothetical protein L7S72_12305 [Flavobacteriales bacterium]|nr:hypothetical protein [Flavobacteriales bacterium]